MFSSTASGLSKQDVLKFSVLEKVCSRLSLDGVTEPKYYVSRSSRKCRATVAAVSFERLRCSISARATGNDVKQWGGSSVLHTLVPTTHL